MVAKEKGMSSEAGYGGEHILPRRWWDGLPDFAKAVWLKAYREAEETEDPAMAAWDQVRKEYVWWPKEGWLRKDSLTAYDETTDQTTFIWLAQNRDWAGAMRPVGELSLPGNRYIFKEEAANFTGEIRRVYEEHYGRMSNSVDEPMRLPAVASGKSSERLRRGGKRDLPKLRKTASDGSQREYRSNCQCSTASGLMTTLQQMSRWSEENIRFFLNL